jgi:hypothetical protein
MQCISLRAHLEVLHAQQVEHHGVGQPELAAQAHALALQQLLQVTLA